MCASPSLRRTFNLEDVVGLPLHGPRLMPHSPLPSDRAIRNQDTAALIKFINATIPHDALVMTDPVLSSSVRLTTGCASHCSVSPPRMGFTFIHIPLAPDLSFVLPLQTQGCHSPAGGKPAGPPHAAPPVPGLLREPGAALPLRRAPLTPPPLFPSSSIGCPRSMS